LLHGTSLPGECDSPRVAGGRPDPAHRIHRALTAASNALGGMANLAR
jgi:hypothetical protein